MATKVAGLGWSVANSGTGEFTITLEDTYPALIAFTANTEAATPADLYIQIDNTDVSSAKTIVINTMTADTPTAADCTVHFTAVLRNSTVA